jgi:SH3-like domain-containing protein
VLFMLEVGSAVIAYAYADQWVRINDEGGRSGWVFYNLVGRRDGSP